MKPKESGDSPPNNKKEKSSSVKVRRATLEDIPGIYACELAA